MNFLKFIFMYMPLPVIDIYEKIYLKKDSHELLIVHRLFIVRKNFFLISV